MRLLFIVNSLAPGGAERQTVNLASSLHLRGHACSIVAIKPDLRLQEACATGVDVITLEAASFIDTGAVRRLRQIVRSFGPTAIVAVNQYSLIYAHLATALARHRVPMVMTFHTTRLLSAKEHLINLVCRVLARRTDALVFVSTAQSSHWLGRGFRARLNLAIQNGVDTERFAPGVTAEHRVAVRARYRFGSEQFVVGICGLLRPEKNHVMLVEAVAGLRRQGVPAVALMVGDGPTRPDVESRAAVLGISDHVRITGLRKDVRPDLAAFDVFTLCSTTETFSLAALEAMAMGLPAVLSEVGGAREMIEEAENGFVFPVGDVDALQQCLLDVYTREPREALRLAARRKVESEFSHAGMVSKYEELLEKFTPVAGDDLAVEAPPG
jgi:L-malate glycosyltransferase